MKKTKEENFIEFCGELSIIEEKEFVALLVLLNIEAYYDYKGENHRPRAIEEIFRELFDRFTELSLERQKSLLEILKGPQRKKN